MVEKLNKKLNKNTDIVIKKVILGWVSGLLSFVYFYQGIILQ